MAIYKSIWDRQKGRKEDDDNDIDNDNSYG